MNINEIFDNLKPNDKRLKDFGFSVQGNKYVYKTPLLDEHFILTVTLDENNPIHISLFDNKSHSPYVLHLIDTANGKFVGQVRQEFEQVLRQIAKQCFEKNIFKSPYAQQLISYVRTQYDTELEYLWEKFPNNAIWRRKDNAKWYGALLTIPESKLGIKSNREIEILDFRILPEQIDKLVDNRHYFLGYHMNKKHWLTARLDGTVSLKELFSRIDESYNLAQ